MLTSNPSSPDLKGVPVMTVMLSSISELPNLSIQDLPAGSVLFVNTDDTGESVSYTLVSSADTTFVGTDVVSVTRPGFAWRVIDTVVSGSGSSLEPFVIYALGQSNMTGSDPVLPTYDTDPVAGVKIAVDKPGHADLGTFATWDVTGATQTLSTSPEGTTPGFHLAKQIHEATGREVRVIISALGGAFLTEFSDGGARYAILEDAIAATGTTKCDLIVLVHGEAENSSASTHLARLNTWVADMRALPSVAPNCPIVITEVNKQYTSANSTMKAFADTDPFVRFASGSAYLPMRADGVHFTADSYVIMGRSVIFDALYQQSVPPSFGLTKSRASVFKGAEYLTLHNDIKTQIVNGFTFRCRFRPDYVSRADAVQYAYNMVLVEIGRTSITDGAFSVVILNGTQMQVWVDDNSKKMTVNIPTEAMDSGNTWDLAVTWDSSAGVLKCFLNGVLLGTRSNLDLIGPIAAGTGPARLMGEAFSTRHAIGVIKWAGFWPTPLADATFDTIADAIPDVSTAILAHRFTNPTRATCQDETANNRDGTFGGTNPGTIDFRDAY